MLVESRDSSNIGSFSLNLFLTWFLIEITWIMDSPFHVFFSEAFEFNVLLKTPAGINP